MVPPDKGKAPARSVGSLNFNPAVGLLVDARRLHRIHVAADAYGLEAAVVARVAGAGDEHAPLIVRAVEGIAVHVALHAGPPARGGELPEGPAAVVVAHV